MKIPTLIQFVFLWACLMAEPLQAQSVSLENWFTDYDSACHHAQENGKVLMLVFSGSDWCKPCMRLEKNVLDREEFIRYAGEELVLLKADFPRLKKNRLTKDQQKRNDQLAERFNPGGLFPLILLFTSEKDLIAKTAYGDEKAVEFVSRIRQLISSN